MLLCRQSNPSRFHVADLGRSLVYLYIISIEVLQAVRSISSKKSSSFRCLISPRFHQESHTFGPCSGPCVSLQDIEVRVLLLLAGSDPWHRQVSEGEAMGSPFEPAEGFIPLRNDIIDMDDVKAIARNFGHLDISHDGSWLKQVL